MILVTGVSGNVGSVVAEHLIRNGAQFKAGVRQKPKGLEMDFVEFDFLEPRTYFKALEGADKVFLMRPPAISNVLRDIKPFILAMAEAKVGHIVFLSLMGTQNNPIPPHYKIERLIRQSGIPCTFLRPSFFMQNLNTTHAEDIKNRSEIFLPAGNSMVSFVDTRDIGEAAAKVLLNNNHLHKSYTLTGSESLTYTEVARIFSQELGRPISYSNPSPLRFRREMIARGVAKEFANVMVALYLTTRLGMAKAVTSDLKYLLGRDPRTVQEYVRDYRQVWL